MPKKRKKDVGWGPERSVSERGETLFTRQEAADYLGVKLRWIVQQPHGIPYCKIGSQVRFRKADLDTYIESRRVVPAGR